MGTFFRAIIAFLKAIILGLGALFVASLGLCAVLVAGEGVANAMGMGGWSGGRIFRIVVCYLGLYQRVQSIPTRFALIR